MITVKFILWIARGCYADQLIFFASFCDIAMNHFTLCTGIWQWIRG